MRLIVRLASLLILFAAPALAQSLVPSPDEAGYDAPLAAKFDGYDRQIHGLLAVPLGFGLEAFVSAPGNRALIDGFIASGSRDFKAQTGKHPYEVLDNYEEFGDLGMFGGVQAAGDAFRYGALREGHAPAAEVEVARAALLRAMDGLHWATQITGEPGAVVRGLRRVRPEAGEPPLPGVAPALTPLFDDAGRPLPAPKQDAWRADRSGQLPFLIWVDGCSKDQLDGYVFGLGAAYDVAANDPSVPPEKLSRLVEDARAIGLRLMRKVEVEPGKSADLVIVDPDGRPTPFHDLSAEEFAPGAVSALPVNGFNALLALGITRTLFHITGDEQIGNFYYDELVHTRNYFAAIEQSAGLMYAGTTTNYSNVNMAFVAAYGVLRYESDPKLARRMRALLESVLYAPGKDREARGLGQSFFDFIDAAFRTDGIADAGATALFQGLETLREARSAPTWDVPVTNCDAAEIDAGVCVGVDGTPITLEANDGRGGGPVAVKPIPMRIRPTSNFEWRSDPHSPNGDGSPRLNPGGELAAAYWMGRFLKAGSDGTGNISASARPRPGTGTAPADTAPSATGCHCQGAASALIPGALLALARAVSRRRRG